MNEITEELRRLNRAIERLLERFLHPEKPDLSGGYRTFRAEMRKGFLCLKEIKRHSPTRLSDLVGIDGLIEVLRRNTLQFVKGYPAHDVLIYGPRGTGKSSAVRALVNEFDSLRMIEVEKDALFHLHDIQEMVAGEEGRFILFCDDLSFSDGHEESLKLKSLLEGGLEARPENLLIYATSNRRHLMPERFSENLPPGDDEIHPAEGLEEKVSLSDRFGIRLGTTVFDMNLYLEIVRHYFRKYGMGEMTEETERDALRWALSHGNYSGRTAEQFVRDLRGRLLLEGDSN
jgi:hypothetical protein